ncbi:MAG: nucleotidyltransferase family protein [Desulforhopalus sp.]
MKKLRVAAIVPAAGLSSRMHAFKPLVTIAGKTIIEHVMELFKTTGIDDIVVVVGHRSEELIPVVEAASCRYVINVNYRDGMFSSIQEGVRELSDTCDAFFLLPVDIPLVRPNSIRQLLDAFARDGSSLLCYPQFQSRRGHPPLIDSSLANRILAYDGQDGLRGLLARYENQAIVVPVEDPFILLDADTREDLLYLRNASVIT